MELHHTSAYKVTSHIGKVILERVLWVLDPRRRCHSLAWRRSLRRWWCVADLASLCARPNFFEGGNVTYCWSGIILKSRWGLLGTLQLHAEEIECLSLQGGGVGDLIEGACARQFRSDAVLGDRGEIGNQGLEAVDGEVVRRA